MIKVSVIIPVYNTEIYIRRCLDSILKQTLKDFEVIIVNDRTLDNAITIAQMYVQADERFRIIENEQNMGLMWTRKMGYTCARGEFVVFCDSDDTLPMDALDILYKKAKETKADVVVSAYSYIDINGKIKYVQNRLFGDKNSDIYMALLRGDLHHSLWAKIYRRDLFNYDYETFKNQTNSEDLILFYQIVKNIRHIAILEKSTYNYFQNLDSSTQNAYTDIKLKTMVFAMNWQYSFLAEEPQYIHLLDTCILQKFLFLLMRGIDKKILRNVNADILNKITFSFLFNHLGTWKSIYFFVLYKFYYLRKFYSYRYTVLRYYRKVITPQYKYL